MPFRIIKAQITLGGEASCGCSGEGEGFDIRIIRLAGRVSSVVVQMTGTMSAVGADLDPELG